MPLSQGLKFFKQLLEKRLKADGEKVKKIKLKDENSFISVSIECKNKTAIFMIAKEIVVEIIKNTKEEHSLNYIVNDIKWGILPL